MRKILFLDFDGVLNTARWHSQADRNSLQDEYGYRFDPAAVTNLKRILDETGAEIVISSSWKFMGLSKLREMWKDRRLPGNVVGITPNSMSDEILLNANLDEIELLPMKGNEIKEWLQKNGEDVSHYVIFDDTNDMLPEQESHFVWTDPDVGISKKDAEQAIMILKS